MDTVREPNAVKNAAAEPPGNSGATQRSVERSPSTVTIHPDRSIVGTAVKPLSELAIGSGSAITRRDEPVRMSQFDQVTHEAAIKQSRTCRFERAPQQLDPRKTRSTQARVELLERHLLGQRKPQAVELFGAIAGALCVAFREKAMGLLERFQADIDKAPTPSTSALAWFGAAQLHEVSGNPSEALKCYERMSAITDRPQLRQTFQPAEIANLEKVAIHVAKLRCDANKEAFVVTREGLMDALTCMQTPRQEVTCLLHAGMVATEAKDFESALRHYQACVTRAGLHAGKFTEEVQTAEAAMVILQSKLNKDTHARATTAGKDSDAVLEDLLLQAAHHFCGQSDTLTAAALFDRAIPRLTQREDKRPAYDAIMKRREIASDAQDGKGPELDLQLAQIFSSWEKFPDTAFCLDRVLSGEQASQWISKCLDVAKDLLDEYGMDHEVTWCLGAKSRVLIPDHDVTADVSTLAGHIDTLLMSLTVNAEFGIRDEDIQPLLNYAEALINNDKLDQIPEVYANLLSSLAGDGIEVRPVQAALEERVKEKTSPGDFVFFAASLRIVIADHERVNGETDVAASSLLEALAMDLSNEPALKRECLECTARVASVIDGEGARAIYFLEAARQFEKHTEGAGCSQEVQEDVKALEKDLASELTPEEIRAARRQARAQTALGLERLFSDAKEFMNELVASSGAQPEGARSH